MMTYTVALGAHQNIDITTTTSSHDTRHNSNKDHT